MPAKRGRRPLNETDTPTRDAIAAAAQRQFADIGYPGTTIRSVAREAGVDARLVTHYFGSKQELFAAVFQFPLVPAELFAGVARQAEATGDSVGTLLARTLFAQLQRPVVQQAITGLLRAAATEPEAAEMVRGIVQHHLLEPLVAELTIDRNPLRGALVGSHLAGIVLVRVIVGVESLVDANPDELIAALGPTLDRYLRAEIWPSPGETVTS